MRKNAPTMAKTVNANLAREGEELWLGSLDAGMIAS
jgi:hypothetical protein